MKQLAFDFYREKRCSKCNEVKSLDEFYRHRRRPDGHTYQCKTCVDSHTYEYRARNPERVRAIDRRSYAKHREKRKRRFRAAYLRDREERIAYARRNRVENREKCNEQSRRHYAKHKQKKLAYAHKYYQKHRARILARSSKYQVEHRKDRRIYEHQYREKNHDKRIANNIKRRACKAEAGGSFTAEEWRALCEKHDNRCLCCGKKKPLTVDHIIPISKGGHSNISNCQPLCQPCNSRKGTKIIDYRLS